MHAHAEACAVPAGGSSTLGAIDARERIDFLRRNADDQARYVHDWKWAWVGIGTATFTGSAAITLGWALGNDPVVRSANIVDNTVVTSFAILTPTVALLAAPRIRAPAIDELLRQTGDGAAGSCLVLARMEELFTRDAADEALNTSWVSHVAGLLVLGALFGILATEAATASNPQVRDAHWRNAIVNTSAGLVLTEIQILTQPSGSVHAYKRYLKGDLPQKASARLSIMPTLGGLAVRMSF
jgi:hypothetical protein